MRASSRADADSRVASATLTLGAPDRVVRAAELRLVARSISPVRRALAWAVESGIGTIVTCGMDGVPSQYLSLACSW